MYLNFPGYNEKIWSVPENLLWPNLVVLAFTRITITKDYRMNELYSTLQKKYKAYYYEQKKINGKNVTNGT